MSHTPQGADRLLIKPAAGARPAPPCTRTNHQKGTQEAASSLKSHTQHGGHQAGNGLRQTDPTSLTDSLRQRQADGTPEDVDE